MINEYVARKVALKDMQPCLICGKPSTTVLYNGSGPDWFYTCDIHLKDNPQFVVPLYTKEYQNALNKLKDLKSQISASAAAKSGSWDGWVSSIFTKTIGRDESDKSKDTEVLDNEESQPESNAEVDKNNNLQKIYDEQVDLVTQLQKKTRKFQLSKITFESRVLGKNQERKLAEKRKLERESYTHSDPEDLLQKFSFPSVPKH